MHSKGLRCFPSLPFFTLYDLIRKKSPLLPTSNISEIHIYLLAVLGLCACAQAFCNWSEQGLLSNCGGQASHCGGFSCRSLA